MPPFKEVRPWSLPLGVSALLALALPGALACGDPAPARNGNADAPLVALGRVSRDRASVNAVNRGGHPDPSALAAQQPAVPAVPVALPPLRSPNALQHFFLGLAALEDGSAAGDVRISQFGDSHTAADLQTGQVRRELQERFGDGGRGFVALGQPYAGYYQEGVRVGMSGWKSERGHLDHGKFVGDGAYGLSGISLVAQHAGARAWTDVSTPSSRVELDLLAQPGGGSVDLYIDGQKQGRVRTAAADYASTFQAFDVPEAPHHIEVRALGDGDVRLYGMALDRETPGISLDALGINGARVTTDLNWNEAHIEEQLHHRDPSLVILAFGTNESGDDTPPAVYERQLVDLLGRVTRAVPSASCLLLGPTDRAAKWLDAGWQTMPKLVEVVGTQARVAEAAGCAFYDQLSAMGGPGTIAAWADESPARARKDRVHLSQEGYRQMGSLFAHDVMHAYDEWKASSLAPVFPVNPSAPANPTSPVPQNQQLNPALSPPRPANPVSQWQWTEPNRPDSIARFVPAATP